MVWSQYSIKILWVHFGNSVFDNSNWDEISHSLTKENNIWNRVQISLRWKKIIVNKTLLSKFWYIVQIYTISKLSKKKLKKQYKISSGTKKTWPPRHLVQLSIWKCGLGVLDIVTQLNSLELRWIQTLLNPAKALWKGLMLYRLNIKLNSNQDLALLR